MMRPHGKRKTLVAVSQDETAHDFQVHFPSFAIAPGLSVWCPYEVFGNIVIAEGFSKAIGRCSVLIIGDNSNSVLL